MLPDLTTEDVPPVTPAFAPEVPPAPPEPIVKVKISFAENVSEELYEIAPPPPPPPES